MDLSHLNLHYLCLGISNEASHLVVCQFLSIFPFNIVYWSLMLVINHESFILLSKFLLLFMDVFLLMHFDLLMFIEKESNFMLCFFSYFNLAKFFIMYRAQSLWGEIPV